MSVFDCQDCTFTTLFEAGAAQHSKETGHFVVESSRIPGPRIKVTA